jgi:translation initiation factor IF-3
MPTKHALHTGKRIHIRCRRCGRRSYHVRLGATTGGATHEDGTTLAQVEAFKNLIGNENFFLRRGS